MSPGGSAYRTAKKPRTAEETTKALFQKSREFSAKKEVKGAGLDFYFAYLFIKDLLKHSSQRKRSQGSGEGLE